MRYRDTEGESHHFTVTPDEAGTRLDVYLSTRLPDASRSFLKRLIDDDLVQVEGGKAKPSAKVRAGSRVTLFLPEPVEMSAEPEAIPLTVLFEDEHLIVIDKPPGMVVHPSPGHEQGTLVNALLHHCGDLSGIGGELRPGIVHRLDRDTSGCIVCAKHDKAHQELTAQFAGRRVAKTYRCITTAPPRPPAGQVEGQIGRHPVNRKKQAMLDDGGRHSLTLYRTLEVHGRFALVECDLKTGRTHQIRVHMRHVHAPLLCDADYGREQEIHAWALRGRSRPENGEDAAVVLDRQALHACRLAFAHPVTEAPLAFESPWPADLARTLALLRAADPT